LGGSDSAIVDPAGGCLAGIISIDEHFPVKAARIAFLMGKTDMENCYQQADLKRSVPDLLLMAQGHKKALLLPVCIGCCIGFIVIIGCLSVHIGGVTYNGTDLVVTVDHDKPAGEAYIQITVYQIQNLSQYEYTSSSMPFFLDNGTNQVYIPCSLDPGDYKIYVYVIENERRETALIRDISVL
jgi:hypothetical protein